MKIRENHKGYLFVFPAFLLLVAILGFPAVAAVLQSFNLIWVKTPSFSLASYQRLITDLEFMGTLKNTVIFVGLTVGLHLLIGMGVALLLNLEIRKRRFFRVVAILPWTVLLAGGQVLPVVLLALTALAGSGTVAPLLAGAAVGLGYLTRSLLAWRFHQPFDSVLLHPAGVLVLLVIQYDALARRVRGRPVAWRGRTTS